MRPWRNHHSLWNWNQDFWRVADWKRRVGQWNEIANSGTWSWKPTSQIDYHWLNVGEQYHQSLERDWICFKTRPFEILGLKINDIRVSKILITKKTGDPRERSQVVINQVANSRIRGIKRRRDHSISSTNKILQRPALTRNIRPPLDAKLPSKVLNIPKYTCTLKPLITRKCPQNFDRLRHILGSFTTKDQNNLTLITHLFP